MQYVEKEVAKGHPPQRSANLREAQSEKKGFEESRGRGFKWLKQLVTRKHKPETRDWGGFNHEGHEAREEM